jgi:hypothetical protein
MLFSLHSLTSGSHVSFPSLSFFNLSPFFLQWLAAGFPTSTPPGSLAALLPHSAIPSTFSAPCSPSYSPTAIAIRSRGCWSSCAASPLACHTPQLRRPHPEARAPTSVTRQAEAPIWPDTYVIVTSWEPWHKICHATATTSSYFHSPHPAPCHPLGQFFNFNLF